MEHIILTHDSALAHWSNPATPAPSMFVTAQRASELKAEGGFSICDSRLRHLLENEAFSNVNLPIELLTPYPGERHVTRIARYRQYAIPSADGAFIPLGNNMLSCRGKLYQPLSVSPELCFVQMANCMEISELIELGYELCGAYSIDPKNDHGFVDRFSVTTPQKLQEFVNRTSGLNGLRKARKAARWVLANSRSPKESQIAMMLTMSRTMRGFGIPAPLLNEEIQLTDETAEILQSNIIIPDMYWPEINTVLEYDSDACHLDAQQHEKDARRRNAYRALGLNVIELTKGQLYDFESFERIALGLFALFGIRRCPTTEKQRQRQEAMHWLLLHGTKHRRQGW